MNASFRHLGIIFNFFLPSTDHNPLPPGLSSTKQFEVADITLHSATLCIILQQFYFQKVKVKFYYHCQIAGKKSVRCIAPFIHSFSFIYLFIYYWSLINSFVESLIHSSSVIHECSRTGNRPTQINPIYDPIS